MDYKYIEQLLERYWACESSVEEEELLRAFFRQEELPAHLMRYRDLFAYQDKSSGAELGADFDARILAQIERPVVRARVVGWAHGLRSFYKAAAVVAVVLTLSTAVQHAFDGGSAEPVTDYNYSGYKDTYTDPEVAYDQVSSALRLVADGLRAEEKDSVRTMLPESKKKDR